VLVEEPLNRDSPDHPARPAVSLASGTVYLSSRGVLMEVREVWYRRVVVAYRTYHQEEAVAQQEDCEE
jgi:hypothetical protein